MLSRHLLEPTELDEFWITARSLYERACFLSPSNGRVVFTPEVKFSFTHLNPGLYYHQIALIDLQKSDRLSALFNFIRSLNVKTPFTSSKDPMMMMFAANKAANEHKIKADSDRIRAIPKRKEGRGGKIIKGEMTSKIEEPVSSLFLRAFETVFTRVR